MQEISLRVSPCPGNFVAGSVDDLNADGVTVAAGINRREPVSVNAGNVLAAKAGAHVTPAFGLTHSGK
jgi:hypothetical protein